MSKKLSKNQKRKKILKKRAMKKSQWEEKCIDKLIEGACILNSKEQDYDGEQMVEK